MDIAKYIGLFLLKNRFCYVHGLGNLELKKLSATHDGKALQPPSYEIIVTPGGSIDDNLANFIAVNEQISISKAANALRDYSIQARKDMAEGKEVLLPNMGKFTEVNGKVVFHTDANFQFTPAGIPTIRNSKQLEDQNAKSEHKPSYPAPTKVDAINWRTVVLVVILLLVLGGGGYGIYYYSKQNKPAPVQPVAEPVVEPQPMPVLDTALPPDTVALTPPPSDTMLVNTYKMVIGDYPTRERADKRQRNLSANGNTVEVVQRDSASYIVVSSISCRSVDTLHVKDSLQRLFGFKTVTILK